MDEDPLRCAGVGCEEAAPGAGTRLCADCREGLLRALTALPGIYEECAQLLGSSPRSARERTTGGPLPGIRFNTAAADTRAAILATLGSWSGLVAAERELEAPKREVRPLVGFLLRHLDWLAAHPAAGEAGEEVGRVLAEASRVARPDRRRRLPVGPCVRPGCPGTLTAPAGGSGRLTAIECDADPEHRWQGDQWTQLGRVLRRAGPARPAVQRWLTAADIALLWNTPVGTVYRLASEQRWRRRSSGGRTYYTEADVHACFSRRAAR
ncbi:hypothetical protein ACFYNO_29865 [Kitasatospora sp. NPDC006697]|uniref:hypothetical protein n=1 Tax=Kitasatospora sp. NPDC006697 TaxID=3364020 RepID=UPI003685BFE2